MRLFCMFYERRTIWAYCVFFVFFLFFLSFLQSKMPGMEHVMEIDGDYLMFFMVTMLILALCVKVSAYLVCARAHACVCVCTCVV